MPGEMPMHQPFVIAIGTEAKTIKALFVGFVVTLQQQPGVPHTFVRLNQNSHGSIEDYQRPLDTAMWIDPT
uniref:Peptidase_S9 domain-containing protein n=1 Tax=Panagrellus redivivus TaxID=6233 RepID=A0A7E4UTH0_PANRE